MNEQPEYYNVLRIIRGTTVDGPGFRTSIYLAGCNHACPGCHNPQSWDPDGGIKMTLEEIMDTVEEEDFDVSISGGDPLYNPTALARLIQEIKKNRRNIWIYTGYTWEEILNSPELFNAIENADILVDGRFIENLRDSDLPFRGSSNQRLINVRESISQNKIILYSKEHDI